MKRIIPIIVSAFLFICAVGQNNTGPTVEFLTIEGHQYLKPSIAVLVLLADITQKEWESTMEESGYSDKGVEFNCPYYGSGKDLTLGVFSISKCPETVTIIWSNFKSRYSVLDDLVAKLEPYYQNRDKNAAYYAMKNEGYLYRFAIIRNQVGEGIMESVLLKKKKIDINDDENTGGNNITNETPSNVVPIQKKSSGVYEIPVVINGVLKISFVFDSGAADVSISPDVAMTLVKTGTVTSADFVGTQKYIFADGSTATSKVFIIKNLKVGNKTVYNVRASISSSIDAPMLLGQSVLQKFGKFTIDNNAHTLTIE